MLRRGLGIFRGRTSVPAAIVAAAIGILGPSRASAVAVDGASVIIPGSVISSGTTGKIASYTYDPVADAYYVPLFGSTTGIRKITRTSTSSPWTASDYTRPESTVYPSDLRRFAISSDVAGGDVLASDSFAPIPGSILLNPTALTFKVKAPANYAESYGYGPVDAQGNISVTYAPGTLAFLTETGTQVKRGTTAHPEWTKKVYRWDLRSVGATFTGHAQPDYNTGKSGVASASNPDSNGDGLGDYGAYGQADWNDVFSSVITDTALHDAYANYQTTHPTAQTWAASSGSNFGRQFAWSTDGQSLYAVEHNAIGGGVYKVSATQGTAKLVYSEPAVGGSNVIAEPTVVATSRRDFGAGFGAGDQVLFDGTAAGGNVGGISYVVDNGTSVSNSHVLISGQTFRDYSELASGGSVTSITSDSHGNVYFYENSTHSLHKYDAQGRLSSVLNKAQLLEVNETQDGKRTDSGGMLRLQVREDATGTHVTYRGNNSYIGAVQVFDTGDFNHDGAINQTDKNFFITQYNKTFHGDAPLTVAADGSNRLAFIDYINADVNGSSVPLVDPGDPDGSGPLPYVYTSGGLTAASVTYKDLLTLKQFVPLELGDLNWNGTSLDNADRTAFNSHFRVAPTSGTSWSWFDGDVTGDGLVNDADYLRLALPADLTGDKFVGIDDFTALQNSWGQHVQAWTLGDISGDGFVGIDDFTILQTEWGQSATVPDTGFELLAGGLATTAAPEPSSIVSLGLAALAAAVWGFVRKNRSRAA